MDVMCPLVILVMPQMAVKCGYRYKFMTTLLEKTVTYLSQQPPNVFYIHVMSNMNNHMVM